MAQGGLKAKNAHSPVNPRRAESPMASIAQGKRSDTLGKPPRHATSCVRVKVNAIGSVSMLLPLLGASCTAHFYPGRRFACRWAMDFCPFGRVPIKCACERSVPSAAPRARSVGAQSPRTASVPISAICGKQKTPRMATQYSSFNITKKNNTQHLKKWNLH